MGFVWSTDGSTEPESVQRRRFLENTNFIYFNVFVNFTNHRYSLTVKTTNQYLTILCRAYLILHCMCPQ